jgi:hypothetical protein
MREGEPPERLALLLILKLACELWLEGRPANPRQLEQIMGWAAMGLERIDERRE